MMENGINIQTLSQSPGVPVRRGLSQVSLPSPSLLQGATGVVTSGM